MLALTPSPSILIADADANVCRIFEAKLTKNRNFTVKTVSSGSEALHTISRQVFDVLLWDLRLRDTAHLLPRLRASCPNAALLLLSTDDRPSLDPEIRRLDVTDILVKPVALDRLEERILSALETPLDFSSASRMELASVGQQIRILSEKGLCITRILENRHRTFLVVAPPRVQAPEGFEPGLKAEVEINGQDALYRFETLLESVNSTGVPFWEFTMPTLFRREQRRDYPRLPLHLPIDLQGDTEESLKQGVTEDISLGGCALIAMEAVDVGKTISFVLQPGSERRITGKGRVVRSQPVYMGRSRELPYPYHLALAFEEMDSVDKQTLDTLLSSLS